MVKNGKSARALEVSYGFFGNDGKYEIVSTITSSAMHAQWECLKLYSSICFIVICKRSAHVLERDHLLQFVM